MCNKSELSYLCRRRNNERNNHKFMIKMMIKLELFDCEIHIRICIPFGRHIQHQLQYWNFSFVPRSAFFQVIPNSNTAATVSVISDCTNRLNELTRCSSACTLFHCHIPEAIQQKLRAIWDFSVVVFTAIWQSYREEHPLPPTQRNNEPYVLSKKKIGSKYIECFRWVTISKSIDIIQRSLSNCINYSISVLTPPFHRPMFSWDTPHVYKVIRKMTGIPPLHCCGDCLAGTE